MASAHRIGHVGRTGRRKAPRTSSSVSPSVCNHLGAPQHPAEYLRLPTVGLRRSRPARPRASALAALASSRAKAPPSGVPSAHAAAITIVPATAPDTLGRRHALHGLIEVAVERVPAVGAQHDVEPVAHDCTDVCLDERARRGVAGRERAGEDRGELPALVDGHVERHRRRRQRHRAAHEVVDGVALRDEPRRARDRRCGPGLWASRIVSSAASPGQAPLGPPLNPAKKWGSTNPVRMRTSAST